MFTSIKNHNLLKCGLFTFFAVIIFFNFLSVEFALAADPQKYIPLAPIDNVSTGAGVAFGEYIPNLYKLGIGLAAALAVVVLAWGGIRYMTSDVISNKSAAVQMMRNAVGGLILALSSFLLLNTINPDLVRFTLNIESANYKKPDVVEPLSKNEIALYQIQANLMKEVQEAKKLRSNPSDVIKRCVESYINIVNQEIRTLAELISIRKNTPVPVGLSTTLYDGVKQVLNPLNFVALHPKQVMDNVKEDFLRAITSVYNNSFARSVQVNKLLETYGDQELDSGNYDLHYANLSDDQKEPMGARLKKAV
jgi:hypothetical protein